MRQASSPLATASGQKLSPPEATDQEKDRHKTGSFGARTRRQLAGAIRTDIDPAVAATLVGRTAYAIARSRTASQELADAFITVMMDGLRPSNGLRAGQRPGDRR